MQTGLILSGKKPKRRMQTGSIPVGRRRMKTDSMKTPSLQPLPLEMVHDILVDLPVKTLNKCRCVCKPWKTLISYPPFQEDHYLRASKSPTLILMTTFQFDKASRSNNLQLSTYNSTKETLMDKASITVQKQAPFKYASRTIPIQSCRGLVCITSTIENIILICNPSSREVRVLPPTTDLTQCIGFGYAANTKEFKVVRFFTTHNSGKTSCDVFTLGTSEWRQARCSPQLPSYSALGAPFLQGALHLLPDLRHQYHLVRFDIEKEECTKIPFPKNYKRPDKREPFLKELGGSLCLISDFVTTLDLWLLKDYDNEEWVKEYTINLGSLCSSIFARVEPLVIMGNGKILLRIDFRVEDEALYCYNPRDKTLSHETTEECSPICYVESLFSFPSDEPTNVGTSLDLELRLWPLACPAK